MEEILASIRKIISEDDEPAAEAAAPAPVPAPAPEPVFEADIVAVEDDFAPVAAEPEAVEDAPLELTQRLEPVDEPAPEPVSDIMAVEDDLPPLMVEETLVEETTAKATASAFTHLASNIMIATEEGMTLEDLVRSMLKPMLKDWLDRHLAEIVDEKVQTEVERLARRGRRF